MRRAIPGPAGELLPPLDASVDRSKPFITRWERESEREHGPVHFGQHEFQGAAWNEMLRQMRQRGDEVCDRVLAQPEQAIDKHSHKIPHITVVIIAIERLNGAFALFKDKSGEMQGSIHPDVLDKYNHIIDVGSVMVLSQIAVFTPEPNVHYLNVTLNNVDLVVSYDSSGPTAEGAEAEGNIELQKTAAITPTKHSRMNTTVPLETQLLPQKRNYEDMTPGLQFDNEDILSLEQ